MLLASSAYLQIIFMYMGIARQCNWAELCKYGNKILYFWWFFQQNCINFGKIDKHLKSSIKQSSQLIRNRLINRVKKNTKNVGTVELKTFFLKKKPVRKHRLSYRLKCLALRPAPQLNRNKQLITKWLHSKYLQSAGSWNVIGFVSGKFQ